MSRRSVVATCPPERLALRQIAVVLPAWQPDGRLAHLTAKLLEAGFPQLVIVDDGSSPDRHPLFDTLARHPAITLCRHPRNCGKGRALKTAFAHILRETPGLRGVVTADADGQHTADDILRVARQLAHLPDQAILGVRTMTAGVPWRSRLGNTLTSAVFALLSRRFLRDTQTGLRGLPCPMLPALLELPGDRYEYEMVMLASLCRQGAALAQLPIQTVYLDGNRASHFRPVRDSLRVYGALLRFYCRPLRAHQDTAKSSKGRLRTA